MSAALNTLFENLWKQYVSVTPSATKVHQLLGSTQNDDVINDHVAFRTFNIEKINLEKLAKPFLELGYKECGCYVFEKKKLRAKHFEHTDPKQPKVFISELLVEEFSAEVQAIIRKIVAQIDADIVNREDFLYSGASWSVDSKDYKALLAESEYAAWLAAWGFRANHFTVCNNSLEKFESIEQINSTLKDAGFKLNTSGGEIKGTPEDLLEQSSTMADKHPVEFTDGVQHIPSCFYEFARRYKKADGEMFTGFIAASADKIFESTNA
jgi:hypothetical protein